MSPELNLRTLTSSMPPAFLRTARAVRAVYRRGRYARAHWSPPFGTRPPIELAVCALFRDEARYLAEWVTFHRLQGVEQFYLYDNLSTDDWRTALEPELRAGIVQVVPWPTTPGQESAFQDCLTRHRADARWIAFIDVDEFLFSPTGRPVREVLHGYDRCPGVVVNWRVYGTNGHQHPPDGLVIENYLMRGLDTHSTNRFVKRIVYPRLTRSTGTGPHHFRHRGGAPVGEDKAISDLWSYRDPPTADILRINHYYAKSVEQHRLKVARGCAWNGIQGIESGRLPDAEIRDDIILRFAPELRKCMSERLRGLDR
jgi:hypothetical protein